MEAEFNIGAYVRAKGQDIGTGKIELVRHETTLDRKGNVVETVIYGVTWLDTDPPSRTFAMAEELVGSARGVPKFDSVEEAEAWLEKQNSPGNWTAKIEDAQASTAEIIEAEILAVTRVGCGEEPCDCQDCFIVDGTHIQGFGCGCPDHGCPCAS